jgi:hypothetical protein
VTVPILYVRVEDYEAVVAERDKLQVELCEAREATCIVRMQDYMDLETVPAIRKLYELWQEAVHAPRPSAEQVSELVFALKFLRGEHGNLVRYCDGAIERFGEVKA